MQSPDAALRVVLADDHHFFREGMRELLTAEGIVVVGEAADGAGAISLTRELNPDVVVVDLTMPEVSGVDAVRELVLSAPDTAVVVLTASTDELDVLHALAAGASGYLLKDTRVDELASALRLAAGGHAVVLGDALRGLAGRVRTDDRPTDLEDREQPVFSGRELQIIRLIANGADNAAIGRELSISRHTVKQHVTNIFEKLGVQNRVLVAVYAVRYGLV
ncbi:MAG TPA: response regulator transcription factor [Solirubrobacteraceae bacterium]|nr:response regulator transcription factor [Solirubrobacteraceae bacterium]